MSLDVVAASPPYQRWCVNVALLSFRGEDWALTCGNGEDSSEVSAKSGDGKESVGEVKSGERENNGFGLRVCDEGFKNQASKIEKSTSFKDFLDVVQKCNDNTRLIKNIKNVEFVLETPTSSTSNSETGDNDTPLDNKTPMRYKLQNPLEPLMKDILTPAVSVVVEECLNAMVLVYGATQEMKQLGVVGTPEECGLLPYGICMVMNRCAERRERIHSSTSWSLAPPSTPEISTTSSTSTSSFKSTTTSTSGNHRFVRAEATFIAFDAIHIVDLLDLGNRSVELALQSSSANGGGGDGENEAVFMAAYVAGNEAPQQNIKRLNVTDAYVCHARTLPAEHASHALEALDIGLDNFTRAAEIGLLQSQAGTSLLYSLTLFTDDRHSATFHFLCFAEDAALQNWIVSSALTFSQSVPDMNELNPTTIRNLSLPYPQPFHHSAAAALVPILSCGNIFTSVLICAYNSVAAIQRLTRDLRFALAGCRMITAPDITCIASRPCQQPLPEGWEEGFTYDGRRYYIETTSKHATWDDPRIDKKEELVIGTAQKNEKNVNQRWGSTSSTKEPESMRVPMNSEDQLYLEEGLRRACKGISRIGESSSIDPPYTIVVVDVNEEKHVLLSSTSRKKKPAETTVSLNVTPSKVLIPHPTPVLAPVVSVEKKVAKPFRSSSPICPDDEDDYDDDDDDDDDDYDFEKRCDELRNNNNNNNNNNVDEVDFFSSHPAVYDVADLTGFIECDQDVESDESDDDDDNENDNHNPMELEKGETAPYIPESNTADTVRFYATVMQGESKMDSSTHSGIDSCNASTTSSSSSNSNNSSSSSIRNSNSGSEHRHRTNSTNAATAISSTSNNTSTNNNNNNNTGNTAAVGVPVSPALQELESLADEFTRFYRDSCEAKRRLQQVELELAREKEENAKLREQLAALKATAQE